MPKSKSSSNGRSKYQPLPDLPPGEFEVLKADIEENGLQYPIIQDEFGNTLDGHQRERALAELNIKNYPTKVIAGLTDEEKWHYALSVNVKRRQLTSAQKRQLIEQELKRTPDISNTWLGEILGIDTKTIQKVRQRLESTLEIPELKKLRGKDGKARKSQYSSIIANTPKEWEIARSVIANLPADGRLHDTNTAQRRAKRNGLKEELQETKIKPVSIRNVRLFHCPFQEMEKVAKLRPRSVHLVLTDIPYGQEFLPQIVELGQFAERVLEEGGLLVTYCGQFHLPQVLESLGRHETLFLLRGNCEEYRAPSPAHEPRAPNRHRHGLEIVSARDDLESFFRDTIKGVHIGDAKDESAPPGRLSVFGLYGEIHEAAPGTERSLIATVADREAQQLVKCRLRALFRVTKVTAPMPSIRVSLRFP